jgi:branched-chain amino acid transport system substrate-binding protein
MLRQMKQLGMTARMLGGDGICLEDLVKLSNGSAYDGQVICVEAGGPNKAKQDRLETFRTAFRKRFGTDAEPVSMYSYDGVWVMVDSMRRAGSADPRLYLAALAKTKGHSGLSGDISFDAKGDLLHPSISFYTFRGATREQMGAVQMR